MADRTNVLLVTIHVNASSVLIWSICIDLEHGITVQVSVNFTQNYLLRLRRCKPGKPASPVASIKREPGSGVVRGAIEAFFFMIS